MMGDYSNFQIAGQTWDCLNWLNLLKWGMALSGSQTLNSPGNNVPLSHEMTFRVRYSETDQMGTFYNSRALEWFECGRTEFLRHYGLPYAEMELRGVFLPLIEARVEFLGRARYDDLLQMTTTLNYEGRARVRLSEIIVQQNLGKPVVRGYTVHAVTDPTGKPIRPPDWFKAAFTTQV